jgi:hypothetical protein
MILATLSVSLSACGGPVPAHGLDSEDPEHRGTNVGNTGSIPPKEAGAFTAISAAGGHVFCSYLGESPSPGLVLLGFTNDDSWELIASAPAPETLISVPEEATFSYVKIKCELAHAMGQLSLPEQRRPHGGEEALWPSEQVTASPPAPVVEGP